MIAIKTKSLPPKGKERPILFRGPMVQALLAGTKTQTRRTVKFPLKVPGLECAVNDCEHAPPVDWCPHGQPGDRLVVRESTCQRGRWLWRLDESGERYDYWERDLRAAVLYAADGPKPEPEDDGYLYRLMPSIHMWRADCRMLLEIVSVRSERLQDISEGDAWAEGVGEGWSKAEPHTPWPQEHCHDLSLLDPRPCYQELWNKINGPGSWEVNPWVWVIEFKIIQPEVVPA